MAKKFQQRFRNRVCRIFLLGCALTLATIGSMQEAALAQPTFNVAICKSTVPPDPTTQFNFIGANTWATGSGHEFEAVYLNGANSNPQLNLGGHNPFPLTDDHCQVFHVTGHDVFNQFTEIVPPGWTLTDIKCNGANTVFVYSVSGGAYSATNPPHHTFQPGDRTVSFDQTGPSVKCTFINTRTPPPPPPPTAQVTVSKFLYGNAYIWGPNSNIPGPFPMQLTCTDPAHPSNPPTIYSVTPNQGAPTSPYAIVNVPVGFQCSLQETMPLPAPPPNCVWNPPAYTAYHGGFYTQPQPTPMTIVGTNVPNANLFLASNTLNCNGQMFVQYRFLKTFHGPAPAYPANTAFNISLRCPSGGPVVFSATLSSSLLITDYVAYVPAAAPPNCTVTETIVPSTFTLPGRQCTWNQLTPIPITANASNPSPLATLINSYTCVPCPTCRAIESPPRPIPSACSPPMLPGATPGTCVCPRGTVQKGSECVRQIVCAAPFVPDAAGAQCVCPQGMVQRGRTCIRHIECIAPLIPNATGTACVCPQGTEQKGRECVPIGRGR